jgi:2-polyprenyl-6-methoxyphenol hydroxylase-like FAD-dependent oxidoreductase
MLLGDAAHPMSPFRGEGANMAMLDALVLVDLLNRSKEGRLEHVLVRYEQEMLDRTRRYVLLSRRSAMEMHSRNPITNLILTAKLRLANHFVSRR